MHNPLPLVSLLMVALIAGWVPAGARAESFLDFLKKDRQEQEDFKQGRTKPPPQAAQPAPQPDTGNPILLREDGPARPAMVARQAAPATPHPDRVRAQDIYNRYCRMRNRLDDPDPEKGLKAGIRKLEGELYPTGRPAVDSYSLWSDHDWNVRWPRLQDMRIRRDRIEDSLKVVEQEWNDAGFNGQIGPLGDFSYGRKSWVFWLDHDANTFPPPIRSNQVDYVGLRIETLWPTAATPPVSDTDDPGRKDPVFEKPPVITTPPESDKYEVTTTNVPPKKSWDDMTVDERHDALKANDPEAWKEVHEVLVSGDLDAIKEVKEALGATGTTAPPPPGANTNLTPVPAPVKKPWKDMTAEERHEALKQSDPTAWDAVRDALLSGDPAQVTLVVNALGAKILPEIALATAYWHGFQLGVQEKLTQATESQLDVVAAAYKVPQLQQLVRTGYADGQAGKPPAYTLGPGMSADPGTSR